MSLPDVPSEDGTEAFDYNNEIRLFPSNSGDYLNLPPHSPRSSTTDEDTFLSTEEFNAALIARERAEDEEGDISDVTIRMNQPRSQLSNTFFRTIRILLPILLLCLPLRPY